MYQSAWHRHAQHVPLRHVNFQTCVKKIIVPSPPPLPNPGYAYGHR